MSYRAPVGDILFALNTISGLDKEIERGLMGDLDNDTVGAILEEAGRFANEVIAPINRVGDEQGARLVDGSVEMPDGWPEAYRQWVEGGWCALPCPTDFGGQELPAMVSMAVDEMWNAASMAFGVNPVLTQAGVDAIYLHGTEELKQTYLPKLVTGEWTASMQLTEAQAGSDLSHLKARAVPQPDGSYKIYGTKIFITYGEHSMTDNIVHIMLARTPDAPEGTGGISLFLVPKFLVNADGSLGERNDVYCSKLEHKLGIHASPTCVMIHGENEGATGWLLGEENHGLHCMFTMMNQARLAVGIQGVAIADRAYQQALAYAQERLQGHRPERPGNEEVPIIEHPDVRRMLLNMQAKTLAARAICYLTAREIDRSELAPTEEDRSAARARAGLLTPLAKAYSTDIGVEVASEGIQVHGGMGYIEETGAAQHLRDARVGTIYEGANGIQAIDLVTRKLPKGNGEVMRAFIAELRAELEGVKASNETAFGLMPARLEASIDALETASEWMLGAVKSNLDSALVGAVAYVRLFALATGGILLAKGALAAARDNSGGAHHIHAARHFAEQLTTVAPGLCDAITEGADAVVSAPPESLVA